MVFICVISTNLVGIDFGLIILVLKRKEKLLESGGFKQGRSDNGKGILF